MQRRLIWIGVAYFVALLAVNRLMLFVWLGLGVTPLALIPVSLTLSIAGVFVVALAVCRWKGLRGPGLLGAVVAISVLVLLLSAGMDETRAQLTGPMPELSFLLTVLEYALQAALTVWVSNFAARLLGGASTRRTSAST